jgi:hypothetical protein
MNLAQIFGTPAPKVATVLEKITRCAPRDRAASTTFTIPSMFARQPSRGFSSAVDDNTAPTP